MFPGKQKGQILEMFKDPHHINLELIDYPRLHGMPPLILSIIDEILGLYSGFILSRRQIHFRVI